MYLLNRPSLLFLRINGLTVCRSLSVPYVGNGMLAAVTSAPCQASGCVFKYNRTLTTTSRKHGQESLEVIYKFRWIKSFRFISRVKLLHVLVVTGLTGPMCYWYCQGTVVLSVFLASAVAATATTGGLFALSYFFRRIVGELSLDKSTQTITISSLTFWGNRRNLTIPVSCLVPLSDSGFDPKHLFHRLELYSIDFVYLLNLRHGQMNDRKYLLGVLRLPLGSNGMEARNEETPMQ